MTSIKSGENLSLTNKKMLSVQELIKRIASEKDKVLKEEYNAEGLVRLQEVAATYEGEDKLVWSYDLLKEIKDRPKIEAHQTNLIRLDEITGGFKEQQLITLSGSTGHGKTTMGLFMVRQFESLSPVIIPLEQSNEEIITQLSENNYPVPRFLSPKQNADRVTPEWVELRVVEGVAKYNTKFVVIDHLGYIKTPESQQRENLAFRIGETMRSLKAIAKRWDVIIFLLVHISQHDEGKPPSIEDIKNSSDISQESDTVMTIWVKNSLKKKVRVYENKAMVSVLKNRRTGRKGNVGLVFDTTTGLYHEDNAWVESMERSAQQQVDTDNEFDSL